MAQTSHFKSAFGHRWYNWLDEKWKVPWAYGVRIVRGAKTLQSPLEYMQRKAAARRVSGSSTFAGKVAEADGYWSFGPDELPGAKAAAAECARIFDELQDSGRLHEVRNRKNHLRAILRGEDFARYPEVGRFSLSRPALEVAAGYFGSAAVLSSICLFWSVKNETVISSQKFHFDGEDVRQLKLFLNVWDHDDAHGPLTFFPASTSADILRKAEREKQLNVGVVVFEDPFVTSGSNGQPPVRVVGEAGSGVFLDTSRCIHYGSRCNSEERLMLMIQYAPYNMARESSVDLGSTDWIPLERSDELQRLALSR
jgi:hypothetical protein